MVMWILNYQPNKEIVMVGLIIGGYIVVSSIVVWFLVLSKGAQQRRRNFLMNHADQLSYWQAEEIRRTVSQQADSLNKIAFKAQQDWIHTDYNKKGG